MKKISRRDFVRMAAQITTAAGTASTSAKSFAESGSPTAERVTRPNVLFIAIDDMSVKVSAFADPAVKTPHIEALAGRGVAFDRAYCQFPLCNPSRISVITGLRPETSGVLSNDIYWRDKIPNTLGLPQRFADHGYDTVVGSAELYDCRAASATSRHQIHDDEHRDIIAQLQALLRKGPETKK